MSRSFSERANDIACRDWACRASRYLRAQIRRCSQAGLLLADDPRVVRAWRRGWDGAHYVRLSRWRDEGFRPEVVYDVGAHNGTWSEMCQDVFSPAEIFLFEPQSQQAERAARKQPAAADWRILPVGLGSRASRSTLYVTRNAAASSLLRPMTTEARSDAQTDAVEEAAVPVEALDELAVREALPLPDLVKIDVQGFEGEVLAGGRVTLARAKRMVVEVSLRPIYTGQVLFPSVLERVVQWGFHLDDVTETFRGWPGPLQQVDLWLRR